MIKEEVEVGRVYRNIKNQKYYRVEGIGKYTEKPMELETMVFIRLYIKIINHIGLDLIGYSKKSLRTATTLICVCRNT